MSSVETNATAAAVGQKRLWSSENQSEAGGYSDTSSMEESEAGKYHRDSENSLDADHSAKRSGTQVTTAADNECPPGTRREEINGKCSSSTPSADVAPSDDAGIPIAAAEPITKAETANEPVVHQEQTAADDGIQKETSTVDEEAVFDPRRAYWTQHNNNYTLEKLMMTSAGLEERSSALNSETHFDDERQQSRSSTPSSSSRNMSPSDVFRRSYQQYGTPFSAAPMSTTMFAGAGGAQRPPFLPAAPTASVAARHHAPFPFFANPFMVPFAPHLPQANVSQQSPSSNEKATPEEWNANMAGVRRNPDSGGFFLHPQYYHELLQQYLRNMAVADVANEETTAPNSSSDPESTTGPTTLENLYVKSVVDAGHEISDYGKEPREVSGLDVAGAEPDNAAVGSSDSQFVASREAVGMRLAGRNDTPVNEWQAAEGIRADIERKVMENAISTASNSNEDSIETSAEGSPLKVSRPETLPLDDATKNQCIESESARGSSRGGVDAENPAMVLIKKQISEIEKQILRKAQNQNIRKMDAKEIEAFLLMEQQRSLEANLFESTTNTGAWASSALPWLQNEGINWERAGAVADVLARQQFEPVPDQRSLYELAAAAAAAAASDPTNVSAPQLNQPGGFVQAHFPQATSAFVSPPQSIYPSAVPWPQGSFYPPGAAPNFGFAGAPGYFPPAGIYGGPVPHHYVANAQTFPAPVPPGMMPQFANGPAPPQFQQQRQLEQDAALRFSQALQMAQRTNPETSGKIDGSNLASDEQTIDGSQWPETGDEHYSSDNGQEDEPVWVLRESYVRKMKREEERQAQKERNAVKQSQSQNEAVEKATADSDAYNETDKLLDTQRGDSVPPPQDDASSLESAQLAQKKAKKKKEVMIHEPAVLIEGVLFRARYLGSTQLVCDGRPTKATRMMQAQEAVSRIKAPDGEQQPSTDVDLFISTEKIMVLNTDLQRISETDVRQDIMMDHPLRTISYIADIGELVVLMARRVSQSSPESPEPAISRTPRIICHVFESEEAQFIAQSIGQAFQVAYMEFLRANGIDDPGYLRDVDYQEVLNQQEIFGEELEMFARKETQKDVVVPKQKNEIFGVVIVESGWGSMLPTVVVANLMPGGPAARSNNLNIGDHIIALNGISFVGLPLSACQNHIRNVRHLTAVKLTVVHTPPVVEVRIKRPDTKYQLGFSVQNGVICSLLRGGIAERGGVRVGHRIIEINSQSVVAVPHEKIVTMLATAVGEIQMKTMPTSMFRLLTGQETPNYI